MSSLPPPGTRVAIYARYSSSMQSFKSIEDQVDMCRDYAARNEWEVADVYSDAERSGTTMVGRAGIYRMMADADAGEFDLVLVEDLDRLSRTASDTHGLVEQLEDLEIQVCTVVSGIVTELEVAFKATQNSQYVKQLAHKTRRGQEGTVKSGRISGSISYGYRKAHVPDGTNGLRQIVPEQAEIVRRIFAEYESGVSTMAICSKLNAEGVPGPRGKGWRPGCLTGSTGARVGLLRNRLYVGEFGWGRTSRRRDRRRGIIRTKATPSSGWVVAQVPHLRIVEDELFEAVQRRLEQRRAPNFNEHRHPSYLFSRKIYCSQCGERYAIYSRRLGCTGHVLKGVCPVGRRVRREDLEQAVLDGLKEQLLVPELIEPALAEYCAETARVIAELERSSEASVARLGEIERQKANVLSQIKAGAGLGFAGKVLNEELERLEGERLRLEREASRKPRRVQPDLTADAVIQRLSGLLDDLRGALESDDREAARARDLIRSLIDRIVVTPVSVPKEDGRGAGPVVVRVEGQLAELMELAGSKTDRVILHGSRTRTLQDDSTFTFAFDVEIPYNNPRLNGMEEDLTVVARLLDQATAPVTKAQIVAALKAERYSGTEVTAKKLDLYARRAIQRLRSKGDVRRVGGSATAGWVWQRIPITDGEWKRRPRRSSTVGGRDASRGRLKEPKLRAA